MNTAGSSGIIDAGRTPAERRSRFVRAEASLPAARHSQGRRMAVEPDHGGRPSSCELDLKQGEVILERFGTALPSDESPNIVEIARAVKR